MTQAPAAPPATIVIFGAFGDLTRRLLVPALTNLGRDRLLDDDTDFIGVDHRDGDDGALREALGEFVEDKAAWSRAEQRIRYQSGDFTKAETFDTLAGRLNGNAMFYLATAPNFFSPIVEALGAAGLLDETDGFRRIVIEKPFGSDLASAQALNREMLDHAQEEQIYRIDHFLGKETVQNIMVTRFGNAMLEAILNNRYVDHVQITAAETVGVGSRGAFYDATGALRDMVPNHLFQLLAMIAMEPPNSFDAEAVRAEKSKLIAAVALVDPAEAVRGRYTAGRIGDKDVAGYDDADDVDPASKTETYAAFKLAIGTWRWSGVPFYVRTGKALAARDTEIVIQFRDAPLALFHGTEVDRLPPNRLVIQVQPQEGISLSLAAKQPGPLLEVAPVEMAFRYADRFDLGQLTGYETLLYDVLTGDRTLFQRAEQIESGWRAVQPVLDAWAEGAPEPYAAGSAGPAGADALIARDGRQWNPLG